MGQVEFRGTLEPFGPAGALVLTDRQVERLGGGRRAPVVVRIGDKEARLRVAVMGGEFVVGLSKANRAVLGVEIGDQVEATISLDEATRSVDVPEDLAELLASSPGLRKAFDRLAFTHQREFVEWITEAKRPETRSRRLEKTMAMLRAGETRS